MKTLIATLLIAIAGLANAADTPECRARLTAHFEAYKALSLVVVVPEGRQYMQTITMVFKELPTYKEPSAGQVLHLAGTAVFVSSVVTLDPAIVCNEILPVQEFIVAHEIGHLLSYVMRDEIKQKGTRNFTDWQLEAWGNEYGAKLFRQAGTDSEPFLARMDAKCSEGAAYFCDRAASWRYGLTY